MTDVKPPKLPPMTALEFTISNTFRHFFFGLRCAVIWLIVLLPFFGWAYYAGFRNGPPDFKALSPATTAAFAVLGIMVLLATVSIAVNWHRRLILDETPKRLAWLRLNGVVWRYLIGFVMVVVVLGMVAGAIFAVMTRAVPALEPQLATGAKPAGNIIAAILGLFGLFTWYRLSTRLPAIATGDKDYTLGAAWKATRNNRLRFLGFTFWLLFSLAIAGGIGAGAFFAQKVLNNTYATGAAYALMGLLAWLALFLVTTISTSHYVHFAGKAKSDEG